MLVLLVEPGRAFVSRVARGARWRTRLVDVATFLAMAVTALGVVGLVARASGWSAVVLIVLLACAAGLALVDPRRARPITRPAFRVVGAATLLIVAVSGTLALAEEVAAIV